MARAKPKRDYRSAGFVEPFAFSEDARQKILAFCDDESFLLAIEDAVADARFLAQHERERPRSDEIKAALDQISNQATKLADTLSHLDSMTADYIDMIAARLQTEMGAPKRVTGELIALLGHVKLARQEIRSRRGPSRKSAGRDLARRLRDIFKFHGLATSSDENSQFCECLKEALIAASLPTEGIHLAREVLRH